MKRLWKPNEYRSCTSMLDVKDVGPVACGRCDNCHKERQLNWIGRILMEMATRFYGVFVTLTYARTDRLYDGGYDPEGARVFIPDHVRLYMMRLRKHMLTEWRQAKRSAAGREEYCRSHGLSKWRDEPPRVRMFRVGERGEHGGNRVHWHILLFFEGCRGPADFPIGRFCFHGKYPAAITDGLKLRIVDQSQPKWLQEFSRTGDGIDWYQSDRTYWAHGMVRYLDMTEEHAFYVAGYIVKGDVTEVARPSQSRGPIVGGQFLIDMAKQFVEQGLVPDERTFQFARPAGYVGSDDQGKPQRQLPNGMLVRSPLTSYWLGRSAVKLLCLSYVAEWESAHARDPDNYAQEHPLSELVDAVVLAAEDEAFRKSGKATSAEITDMEHWFRRVQRRANNAGRPDRGPVDRDAAHEAWYDEWQKMTFKQRTAAAEFAPFVVDGEMMVPLSRRPAGYSAASPGGDISPPLISRAAIQKMAEASFSECASLKRRHEKRLRKLKLKASS